MNKFLLSNDTFKYLAILIDEFFLYIS